MRWDELFAELEAEFSASIQQEHEAEIADMVHAEAATVSFVDRLRHRTGEQVQVRLRNGESRRGEMREANHAWVMLHEQHRRFLIPQTAVAFAWPLGGAAPKASGISAQLTLGYALRTLASGGLAVRVITEGGELHGRIGMVGADYCDIHTATALIAVPWSAIIAIEG